MSLNLSLLSSSLNSPLEQLPKLLWLQGMHVDKTFHTQRLKKNQNPTNPITEAAHEGGWWWFLLDYCLRTTICKCLIPGDFLGGKSWEGVFPRRCHLPRQVACPDDPGAEIALWWLMRPSVAVNSAICNHFSYRPFGNHFGKFLFEQCRFWGEEKQSYFSCCREGFRQK